VDVNLLLSLRMQPAGHAPRHVDPKAVSSHNASKEYSNLRVEMEFAIGTLIGIASVLLAFLGYRTGLRQSFKRIHYTSFITPLIIPDLGQSLAHVTVYQGTEELIFPFLCVARIENTGRAPILPTDFDGPIITRHHNEMAIFRYGRLGSNRPGILDPDKPNGINVNVKGSEVCIGPTLLNPRDSITIEYVADIIPEEWELQVTGRIAGVEELLRIPRPNPISTNVSAFGTDLIPIVDTSGSPPVLPSLTSLVMICPILISDANFNKKLQVLAGGREYPNAHLITVSLRNAQPSILEEDSRRYIQLATPDAKNACLEELLVSDDSGVEQRDRIIGNRRRYATCNAVGFRITTPRLPGGWGIRVSWVISGDCSEISLSSHGFNVTNSQIIRMDTTELIKNNLAQAQSRVFVTTQAFHKFRRYLENNYPAFRGVFNAIQRFWTSS
jgi:hypothetical protein